MTYAVTSFRDVGHTRPNTSRVRRHFERKRKQMYAETIIIAHACIEHPAAPSRVNYRTRNIRVRTCRAIFTRTRAGNFVFDGNEGRKTYARFSSTTTPFVFGRLCAGRRCTRGTFRKRRTSGRSYTRQVVRVFLDESSP